MYVCGVTVYDYTHIGHGRTFISFDIIRRWLEASGYKVTFVRNITDVDDKIIRRAAERHVTCEALTDEFARAMQEDMIALGCLAPTVEPRATHFIPQMLGIIDKLEKKDDVADSLFMILVQNKKYDMIRAVMGKEATQPEQQQEPEQTPEQK